MRAALLAPILLRVMEEGESKKAAVILMKNSHFDRALRYHSDISDIEDVEFLLILPVLRPTHGSLTIGPLINIPKGFSSKTTLEVPPTALESRMLDS